MTAPVESTRPTPLSEKTLAGGAIGINLNLIVFALILTFGPWAEATASERAHYLGGALLGLALANLVVFGAFVSPWVGSITVKGMGLDVGVAGAGEDHPDRDAGPPLS